MKKKTTNCHIKNSKRDSVYCGRGKGLKNNPLKCKVGENGFFGNPISINKVCPLCGKLHKKGGETLLCYEKYLFNRLHKDRTFNFAFYELKGKDLSCFCKPRACHTDVMIKYLDNKKKIEVNNL